MFTRQHDFLVAIDSDGCVFDTMELKHKECFIPLFIERYHLQGVSKYARETWEFVNLYSKSRGSNRFPALVETLDRLQLRPEVASRGLKIETPASVREWIKNETRLGNPALKQRVEATGDEALKQLLAWSLEVNAWIDRMVHGVAPFPFVRGCLQTLGSRADLIVCSATPTVALQKEWEEHSLAAHVAVICGQEMGTKKEILAAAKGYPDGNVLMIGDAPGDYKAAESNGTLFFPICPGREETSWQQLLEHGCGRLFGHSFAGDFQDKLLAEFDDCLPLDPPWKTGLMSDGPPRPSVSGG